MICQDCLFLLIIAFVSLCAFGKPISIDNNTILTETKIISSKDGSPTSIEYFNQMDTAILLNRNEWRRHSVLINSISEINSVISHYSYHLQNTKQRTKCSPSFDLMKGDSIVYGPLCDIKDFQYLPNSNKFIFTGFSKGYSDKPHGVLVKDGHIFDWNSRDHEYFGPLLLGNSILQINRLSGKDNIYQFEIVKDSIQIYHFSGQEVTDNAVKYFFVHDSSWVLELENSVIVNGIELNSRYGYSDIFDYHYINDKALFFCKDSNMIKISFNEKLLPITYDEVIHYRCCEPSVGNVDFSDNYIWFNARRDGFWYFGEIYSH